MNLSDLQQTLVSIVVPTFNRATPLRRAMASVFSQTFCNWELIIVDDGSQDETRDLAGSLHDPRVSYLRHECNRGVSAARNTGIRAARGGFIAFLDSDDEWSRDKLALDMSVFDSRENVGFVYSGERALDSLGRLIRDVPSIQGKAFERILAHNFVGGCSRVIIRKAVLDAVGGFDEQLVNEEDWDLWVRVADYCEIGYVSDCTVIRHYGDGQLTSSPGSLRKIYEGRRRVVEKHCDRMTPAVLAEHMAVLAGVLFNYDIVAARELARRSLVLNRFQPRLVAAVFASYLGLKTYRFVFSRFANLMHSSYFGRAKA